MGILFSFAALLSWGIGDFLIQKSARRFGNWIALFYITVFEAIVLFPFAIRFIGEIFLPRNFFLLVFASTLILFVALLEFEALRVGKISVIEPILALEVPITVLLATFILHEYLTMPQSILIVSLLFGIFLVSVKSFHHFKKIHLEKGVWYALFATIGMGTVNFLFGVGARETHPVFFNWFTSSFIAVVTLVYIFIHSKQREVIKDLRSNPKLILGVSMIDNVAWLAYSYATLFIPIAIAIGISESYIALASVLGIIINKEKLARHQLAGLILCIVSVIALALIIKG